MRSSETPLYLPVLGSIFGIVVTFWATAGRTLFNIDGTLTLILSVVGAPLLLATYLCMLWIPVIRQRRGRGRGISRRAGWFFVGSLIAGTVFGFLSPDFGTPEAKSIFEFVAGSQVAGMSAAIANPFGIGTLFFAAFSLGFALTDSSGKKSYVLTNAEAAHHEDGDEDLMIPAPWLKQQDEG